MREVTLNDLRRHPGPTLRAVDDGEVLILRWWERRIALICPYPRAYKMDAERFRRLMEEMTDDLVAERQHLPGPGGPRCRCLESTTASD